MKAPPRPDELASVPRSELVAMREVIAEITAALRRGGVIALDAPNMTTSDLVALLRRMKGTDA